MLMCVTITMRMRASLSAQACKVDLHPQSASSIFELLAFQLAAHICRQGCETCAGCCRARPGHGPANTNLHSMSWASGCLCRWPASCWANKHAAQHPNIQGTACLHMHCENLRAFAHFKCLVACNAPFFVLLAATCSSTCSGDIACIRPECCAALLKAFRGHLGELLRHPAGCHVVDDLYAGPSSSVAAAPARRIAPVLWVGFCTAGVCW